MSMDMKDEISDEFMRLSKESGEKATDYLFESIYDLLEVGGAGWDSVLEGIDIESIEDKWSLVGILGAARLVRGFVEPNNSLKQQKYRYARVYDKLFRRVVRRMAKVSPEVVGELVKSYKREEG